MKRLELVTMLAAGVIALSPAVSTFTNPTDTVLAAKTKKHRIRRKKHLTAHRRLVRAARKPFRIVYIDIPKSDELYPKAIDAMNAWNSTGAFTFKQILKKSKANIVISLYDTGHLNDANYRPKDTSRVAYTVGLHWKNNRTNILNFYRSNIHLDQWDLHNVMPNPDGSDPEITVIVHELGHTMGLLHTKKNSKSVMSPLADYKIQPRDVYRVKRMYHEK